ncbi:TPA: DUF2635 domain-containing protein [Escherichia coli]|nr:DUF2635 domain-containing protein [Escherichia coli]HAY0218984.1 DUF2635 domain-containing protein [Escherichia coli]HAY0228598.1 DUF2635 domain-containing protein [Escherichia coli]HAY0385858.1 DUF2635 domain-containing protein [Escherichia coli]HEL8021230.1 DUF2635 domain-containing protein [Escherichia coli]
MFVKPVPGRRVRYPGDPSRLLPDGGAEVPDRDLFWRRRLKQGDVVLVEKASTVTTGKAVTATTATGSTSATTTVKGGDA